MKQQSLLDFIVAFFRELLLVSGQFAVFYLLMNVSQQGLGVFANTGHLVLVLVLAVQTGILARWGERPWRRFAGSLIAPLVYTLVEIQEGLSFVLNAPHIWFWVFSLATGTLHAILLKTRRQGLKIALEFGLTTLNVLVFLVLYFYFDVSQSLKEALAAGTISQTAFQDALEIDLIWSRLPWFFGDPTHIFVALGGLLLALSISLDRSEILLLKERINMLFGQYVDSDVRDTILAGKIQTSRTMELAVLFSDIRGFTTLSEQNDPQQVTALLNRYFSHWDKVVRAHGGIIDKFIGDAVMVVFGLKDSAGAGKAAVECAVEMLESLPGLRVSMASEDLPELPHIGIGIHFGTAMVGDIGSDARKNFTVIGDVVNTASRLEGACKSHRQQLIVSQDILDGLDEDRLGQFEGLGHLQLKGKEHTVAAWAWGPARF